MRKTIFILSLCALCLSLPLSAEVLERGVLYRSVDQHGDSLTVSGRLMVPQDSTPKGIMLIPHYTIFCNDEAPSNNPTHDAKVFRDDYVVLQPDYVGYGVTVDRTHPYLYGELAARNTVDLYLAMLPVLDSMALGIPLDSVYILGYSQGGATALWTLKLIEEEYADRIHVKCCFAGGGPYDVAATFDEASLSRQYAMPMIIPILVMGTSAAYDLDLEQDYFFTPALQRAYAKWIEPKNTKPLDIYFRMPVHLRSHWLTPQAMDKTLPQTQRFYAGLLRSSLVHYPVLENDTDSIIPTWKPQAPLYIFHSTNDDIVTVRCSQHLQRCYGDLPNITWDFGRYGHHIQAVRVYVDHVMQLLEE